MNDCTDYNKDCPIRMVLDRIADKWTVLIVRSLMNNTKRFGELRKDIHGISQKMLTQTLRAMERDGLIKRKIYPTIPVKVEYSLTSSGESLIKILSDIQDWSIQNVTHILESRKTYDAKHIEEKD